jgi:hypothetical protein
MKLDRGNQPLIRASPRTPKISSRCSLKSLLKIEKNALSLRHTRTNAKLDACIIMSISRVRKKIEDNEIDSSGLMEPFESGST